MEYKISDNIRFYRKQMGLTQEQLSEAMGVSTAAVSKWEQGQSLPEIAMLMELADFFDVSVDALLGYTLRANDRESVSERLKMLRCEERLDEALAETEKALQKFPNSFSVVYASADVLAHVGGKRNDRAMCERALKLMAHAIRLLGQNSDPSISELSIRLDMVGVLSSMQEPERALALLKANNFCGLLNDQIGAILAGFEGGSLQRYEEAMPYLSMALLSGAASIFRTSMGFANVYEKRGELSSAIAIMGVAVTFFEGLKKPGVTSELDKLAAGFHAARARMMLQSGETAQAREELAVAKELARAYDRAPSSRASDVRFFEGPETTRIYSYLSGGSAAETVETTFLENGGTPQLKEFWQRAE